MEKICWIASVPKFELLIALWKCYDDNFFYDACIHFQATACVHFIKSFDSKISIKHFDGLRLFNLNNKHNLTASRNRVIVCLRPPAAAGIWVMIYGNSNEDNDDNYNDETT